MRKYILLNLTGLLVFFLFTCMFISCGKSGENRLKCAQNLGQITMSMIAFSGDHGAFFPWHLGSGDKKHIFGKGNPEHLGTIFALEDIRLSLDSPKMLHSSCDPDRKAIADYKGYSARENKPIPHAAISYGLCPGSEDILPETILSITRNVSGADLKGATFLGNVMKGLEAGQGQYGTSDGSVRQADDARLKEDSLHHAKARGGISPDPPSTKIWLPK